MTWSDHYDVNDPEATSTFRTSILTHDSTGNGHEITVFGTRNGSFFEWELNAVVDEGVMVAFRGYLWVFPLGNLLFTNDGRLQEEQIVNPLVLIGMVLKRARLPLTLVNQLLRAARAGGDNPVE